MDRHRHSPWLMHFGGWAPLCRPPSSPPRQASPPSGQTAIADRSPHVGTRLHPFCRIPRPAAAAPGQAENRNPHSSSPVARGFLHGGLSYACRHPKPFTIPAVRRRIETPPERTDRFVGTAAPAQVQTSPRNADSLVSGLRVVRGFSDHSRGRVYWLRSEPPRAAITSCAAGPVAGRGRAESASS